jgi:hypothetical protein
MTYIPKYTTVESIAIKVKDRFNILNQPEEEGLVVLDNFGGSGYSDIKSQDVELETLILLIEEAESLVDLYLGQVYCLPLKNHHPVIRKCVDHFVAANLIEIFFTLNGSESSSDVNTYGQFNYRKGYQILAQLLRGTDVFIPFEQMGSNIRDKKQFLMLPGETLHGNYNKTIPTNSGTFLGKRKPQHQKEQDASRKQQLEDVEYINFGID